MACSQLDERRLLTRVFAPRVAGLAELARATRIHAPHI